MKNDMCDKAIERAVMNERISLSVELCSVYACGIFI
jgi:hypothetical protein